MGNLKGESIGPASDWWAAQNLAERIVGRIYDLAGRAGAAVKAWRGQIYLERQLSNLDDRDLLDVGIERDQIADIARSRLAPELLRRMLERLKIGEDVFANHPELRRELGKRCRACEMRSECRRWLRQGGRGEAYRDFCRNAPALIGLAAER
jgi:uncharacterized protein YjiS (DUF1127 family)